MYVYTKRCGSSGGDLHIFLNSVLLIKLTKQNHLKQLSGLCVYNFVASFYCRANQE